MFGIEFWLTAWLHTLLGCPVFEDLSSICGGVGWGVPW
jgi:hypothetical protein